MAQNAGGIVKASDDALTTRMGCRLRRVAAQAITSGALTAIQWDTEDEDTHGFIVVTSGTITIPTGCNGLYDITAWTNAQAVAATYQAARNFIELAVTAATAGVPAHVKQVLDSVEDNAAVTMTSVPLLAGDTVAANYFQSTGSNQNVSSAWITCYRKGV